MRLAILVQTFLLAYWTLAASRQDESVYKFITLSKDAAYNDKPIQRLPELQPMESGHGLAGDIGLFPKNSTAETYRFTLGPGVNSKVHTVHAYPVRADKQESFLTSVWYSVLPVEQRSPMSVFDTVDPFLVPVGHRRKQWRRWKVVKRNGVDIIEFADLGSKGWKFMLCSLPWAPYISSHELIYWDGNRTALFSTSFIDCHEVKLKVVRV